MAKKIEIIDKAIVITDTVTTDVVNEFPQGDVFFDSKKLAVGIVQFYDTSGTNPTGSVLFKEDLANCVDSTLTPFTEATFRDFSRVSLGFNPAASGGGFYTTDGQLAGPRVVDANGNNLTFDNVGTFKVENVGQIVFDDTANISFIMQRGGVTLFEFGASSNSNAAYIIGTVNGREFQVQQGRGLLLPRLGQTQENALTGLGTGLMLINTAENRVRYYDGTVFQNLAFVSDLGGSQLVSCCPFGAKSDGTGKFLIANGKSSDGDDSSKDKTRQPIPYDGTLIGLAYKTKEADSTTTMKIHVNGVVEQTVILTNINADNGGIEALSVAVSAGDHVEIEYDGNQKPGECTMSLNLETS